MAHPPSSPRLPSPPPPAEIQISPKSPSGDLVSDPETAQMEQSLLDANSRRRVHPGTKAADMAAGPPLVPLNELDSAFQLQEHLAALHHHHTAYGTEPLTRATALQLAEAPPGVDRTIWLYELCRFLISQCNSLIVGFLFDSPPCSANTCPEMRASEWQFLCAVHEQPKSCCAIDYCCHTLDWAANIVTDQKIFPSRFVVLNDANSKNVGVKNLVNVFRRLHRIFAHAWFQHRSVFWSVEGLTGLYVFFKTVCDLYDLLPAENYKLPPEAEGLEAPPAELELEKGPHTILKPSSRQRAPETEEDHFSHPSRTNTRRHIRSSPSTGSAVTTVVEADEEDGDGITRKMRDIHITAPETVDEEPEVAEVPVIVEQSVMAEALPQALPPQQDADDAESQDESEADQTVIEVQPEDETIEEAQDKEETAVPTDAQSTSEATNASTSSEETTGDEVSKVASETFDVQTSPSPIEPTVAEDTEETGKAQTSPNATKDEQQSEKEPASQDSAEEKKNES
ncbi:MOB kinase activator-like [Paramyrothecium foliicola]|nr:MOB kinase activator-like [Paramyrothecium foliicola]